MNGTGETSKEENINWIPNLHPKQGIGWVLIKGLAIGWIFSFISLILMYLTVSSNILNKSFTTINLQCIHSYKC